MTPEPENTPEQMQRRYRWQCRRGASEVEGVLNLYLDRFFLTDSEAEREQFGRLLECHDVDMLDWFTGHAKPEDPALRDFVARLLDRVATKG